jgi:hypothetical protein
MNLSLEDLKVWLGEQDGKVFYSRDVCGCPIAQYAKARFGQTCWVAYDEIWPEEGPRLFKAAWIQQVIDVIDEEEPRPLSAKEVLALL